MMPGTQPDSYVNDEALTKSLIVWQTVGEVLIFIARVLHTAVLI